MSKKILISLSVIGVVAAIVIGATTAYFSDTETSTGNLFKAGTIDIHVDGDNFTWTEGALLEDMKPSYTDYINFTIYNDGSEPNPVNVWKRLILDEGNSGTGVVSEPECTEQEGVLVGSDCDFSNCDKDQYLCKDNNDIASIINYDLLVKVYNADEQEIWWQAIYAEDVTVAEVIEMSDGVFLGMIPAGGKMEVIQSYHMQDVESTNWAQGDVMAFDIEVKAVQLRGEAWLENKTLPDGGQGEWKIAHGDGIQGTLIYKVKNPTFDFSFTGKAPLPSHSYVLAAGMNPTATGYDVDTYLGEGSTDGSGDITITGDVELGKHMKDVKVWLVPEENWSEGVGMNWSNWPTCVPNILWETGLIWYEDTDI